MQVTVADRIGTCTVVLPALDAYTMQARLMTMSVPRITMSAPHSQQVPRFTTMLRSFAASASAAEDSSAAQHVQRSALLQRKRAQAASAEVTALHLGVGRIPHAMVSHLHSLCGHRRALSQHVCIAKDAECIILCVCSLLGLAPQSSLRQYWGPGTVLLRRDAMRMNDTQRPFLLRWAERHPRRHAYPLAKSTNAVWSVKSQQIVLTTCHPCERCRRFRQLRQRLGR